MTTLSHLPLSTGATDFIDDARLTEILELPAPDKSLVGEVLAKSLAKQPLEVAEVAVLLRCTDPEQHERIFETARQLKRDVYGNRIVLFAPLYIGNRCQNDCQYCAFRRSNPEVERRTLTELEIRAEVEALEREGHKRLIVVFGEHRQYSPDFIARTIDTVYQTRTGRGEIRRVNINAAPLDVDGYRIVSSAGIGTYQVFQETYHHQTYARYHPPNTRKGDYLYRLDALSRAQQAGIDDVGIGALFGLYDWRFEVLAMVTHGLHLQERFGVGPHTISFPRLQPAHGVELDDCHTVSDYDFKRLVATLRLAVPYTGLILTARERAELRREVLGFGVSQIDAGTRVELGGYASRSGLPSAASEQFRIADMRSLDEVMRELIEDNYLPSFCTACYRLGRTGEHFMEFAIPGFIQNLCTPNALTTLMEYLMDYGSPETRAAGVHLIQRELEQIPQPALRQHVQQRLRQIQETDARDLYF